MAVAMIMNTLVNNLSAPPIIPSKYTLSDMEKRQYASVCIFGDFGALKPITTNAANNNAAKAIVTEMTGRESQGPMVLAKHMAKPSNGGSVVHVRRGPNAWVLQARAQIRSSEQQMDTAFGRLATACAERIEKMGPQKPVKVKGRWTTRAFSQKELKAEKERVLWLKNRRNDLTIEPNVIEHIEVPDDGPHVSLGTLMRDTEVLKKTKKVLAPVRGHCALECDIANLLHETLKIFGSRGKPVEVIEKGKRTRISNVRRGKRWYIRCFLPHMRGEKLAQELNRTSNLESLVRVYNRKFNRDVEVDMRSIKPGDSGIVYNGELLRGQRVETEHFIVRGKLNGRLIDARSYMEVEDLLSIKEF
nr:P1 protein [Thunberg fritillary mosaic virus]